MSGCASYVTPGAGVSIPEITDAGIAETLARKPAACAAAFIDTRTGYVYGVGEFTANEEQRSDVWNSRNAIEKARARAERGAFVGALGEMEKVWKSITTMRAVSSAAPSPTG